MLTTFSRKQMDVSVSLVVQFLISYHTLQRVHSTDLPFKYSCNKFKTSGGSTFSTVPYTTFYFYSTTFYRQILYFLT